MLVDPAGMATVSPSHFNVETPFDAFVAPLLAFGGFTLVVTITTLMCASFRTDTAVPVSLRVAIRVGFVALFGAQVIFLGQPMWSERIELLQRPLNSEVWVLFLAGIGFWTAWRSNGWPGWAAIRVSTIASLPLVLIGLLMLLASSISSSCTPGRPPRHSRSGGSSTPSIKGDSRFLDPAPIVMLLSPLLRLPGAWLWGVVGGGIAHWISRARRRQTASV